MNVPAGEHAAMLIAAGSQVNTGDLISSVLQYGLLGLLLLDVSFFHKVLVPRWVFDDKQRRVDQLEAALDTMTGNFMTEVVPLLSTAAVEVRKSAAIAEKYVEVLQERDRDR